MFGTIKSLIPEPRQADQPRSYVGRHRQPEPVTPDVPVSPAPIAVTPSPETGDEKETEPETAAV